MSQEIGHNEHSPNENIGIIVVMMHSQASYGQRKVCEDFAEQKLTASWYVCPIYPVSLLYRIG